MIHVPVTFEAKRRRGARRGTDATSAANSSRIGSIIGEWKACEVFSGVRPIPAAFSPAANCSTSSIGPATTQLPGALTLATVRVSGSRAATSASSARTASIAPGGRDCISAPRAATSFSASPSSKTPARVAATYSPIEWPTIAAGRTPQDSSSTARAYSITNKEGWVYRVSRSRASASAPEPNIGSRMSTSNSSRAAHASIAARKTGSLR